mmetsp:Transcript_5382/g.5224  ORF Transcript_5382/g.5224 Transcript_5382/m.5224 type:complete len:152 (+) Transcript_5382:188-643(+)
MIKNPLLSKSMNTLIRLNNKQIDGDRVNPFVTPVHSDDEESNNEDQSSDCINIFEDHQPTTLLSSKVVHFFFPVPEQMINYDTYAPLSPAEADENQHADFFADLGEVSFLIKEEGNEKEIQSRIIQTNNDDIMTTTKRRRTSESSIDDYAK